MNRIAKIFCINVAFHLIILAFPGFDLFAQTSDMTRVSARAVAGDREAQQVLEIINQSKGLKTVPQLRPLLANYGGFGTSLQYDISSHTSRNYDIALLIAVPLYSRVAVSAALKLVAVLSDLPPAQPVRIAFLADEQDGHRGLLDQLDQIEDPEAVVVLYIDVISAGIPLNLYQGSESHISPRQLIEQALSASKRSGIPLVIPQPYNELFRLNLTDSPEPLKLIQRRGFPALYISDSPGPALGTTQTTQDETELSTTVFAKFLQLLVEGLPPNDRTDFDYHYTLLAFNKSYVLIDEKTTVILILLSIFSVTLFFLVYSILFRRKIISHWVVFIRRSWVILLYYGLLLLCLYGSRLLFLGWFIRAGSPAQYSSAVSVIFLLLWFSLFSLVSPITHTIVIPKRSAFYGHGAVFLLLLGLIIAVAIDIALMPVFLWALFWVFLGSFAHSFSVSLFATILAPIQLVVLFIIAITRGTVFNSVFVYPSSVLNSLLVSFIALPFILLWKRTSLLRRVKSKNPKSLHHSYVSRTLFFAAMVLSLFNLRPNSKEEKTVQIDTISNDKPLDFVVDLSSRIFLDQKTLSITLRSQIPLDRYDIVITGTGSEPVHVIESTIPFINLGPSTVQANLANHPDNPFHIELLLPKDQLVTLDITGVRGTERLQKIRQLP